MHLVDEDKIRRLHKKHFDDPSITDCITLPIDEPGPDCEILGEIFVCPKTAISYAKAHGLDPHTECTLYIVHGFLHLIGYDDIDDDDEEIMRKKEKELMNHLSKHNLILTKTNC